MPSNGWTAGGSRLDPRLRAALYGLLAYLAGYAVVVVAGGAGLVEALHRATVAVDGRQVSLYAALVPEGATPGPGQVLGWLFYGAQLVEPRVVLALGPAYAWLFAVPPLCLAAAGGLAARRGGHGTAWEAGVAGASVVLGYLPAIVLGSLLLFRVPAEGAPTAGPDVLLALLVGIGYPYLWGGLGGVAARELRGGRGPRPGPTG